MPSNTVRTCNCQYAKHGKLCGKPPHFMHAMSGKVYCFNHYSILSVVTDGWVNLQRKDAADAIAKLRGEPLPEPSTPFTGLTLMLA